MNDFVLFGLSFPYIILPISLGYVIYKIIMLFISFTSWWEGVWQKPLFHISVYGVVTSLLYIVM